MTSERPAHERLVHFWSNHFTVSAAKPAAVALPPSFERDAIRPHVGGRFADMLLASTKHPGMIVYLDNWLSIGPNSQAAQNPRRARGLPGGGRPTGINENLGREILELHTLGVNGGYLEVAERLQDNYPYFHPLYAGQMHKPPHPMARLAYTLAIWINPNNHALDGGRASSYMEKEAVAEIARMIG